VSSCYSVILRAVKFITHSSNINFVPTHAAHIWAVSGLEEPKACAHITISLHCCPSKSLNSCPITTLYIMFRQTTVLIQDFGFGSFVVVHVDVCGSPISCARRLSDFRGERSELSVSTRCIEPVPLCSLRSLYVLICLRL
jgi:hypothetical protein